MLKGWLEWVPEVAAVTVMATLGTFFVRKALKSDFASQIAQVPFVGPLLVSGPTAVYDEAYA